MNSWYTIRAQALGAEVVIYDEIGAYGVSAKGFLAELGALPDGTPLALRLNSPGGSVFDAVAIYNAIKRHSGTVTVWIDGIAASAASYIAMAGDEVVMPENAFLMIHDPAGVVMGTATAANRQNCRWKARRQAACTQTSKPEPGTRESGDLFQSFDD